MPVARRLHPVRFDLEIPVTKARNILRKKLLQLYLKLKSSAEIALTNSIGNQ